MLPARTGTGTAPSGSSAHWKPMALLRWASVPERWTPGSTHTQPLSSVASVIAIQQVRYACGSTYV